MFSHLAKPLLYIVDHPSSPQPHPLKTLSKPSQNPLKTPHSLPDGQYGCSTWRKVKPGHVVVNSNRKTRTIAECIHFEYERTYLFQPETQRQAFYFDTSRDVPTDGVLFDMDIDIFDELR